MAYKKAPPISLRILLLLVLRAMAADLDEEEQAAYKENVQIQTEILTGVKTVATVQRWGFICTFGPKSVPLLLGIKDNIYRSVAVAGRFGKGRIVGFGHDAALDEDKSLEAISERELFFDNVFKWVGGGKKKSALWVYTCWQRKETFATLVSRFDHVSIQVVTLSNSVLNTDLKPFDVVVVTGSFSDALLPKLEEYIKEGGGVVVAATNWWYGHLLKADLRNWAPRKLTSKGGFVYYSAAFDYPDGNRTLYTAFGVLKTCPVIEPSDVIKGRTLPPDD